MNELRYRITEIRFARRRSVGLAVVLDQDEPNLALVRGVQQDLAIDIEVEVGGITMLLAAWEDPDHWSEDVIRAFGLGPDEDPWEAVADHLRGLMA